MMSKCRTAMALALWAAASARAADEAMPPRPIDRVGVQAGDTPIEWRATWQDTYDANKKRWTEELHQAVKDKRLRDQTLSLRLIELLEALLRRFPADAEHRLVAWGEIADRLADAGCRSRANAALKSLIDSCPGAPDVAVAALQKILQATLSQRRELEDGEDWAQYAIRRLLALQRAGRLLDQHPAVELAWRAELELARDAGRLWDAARALGRIEKIAGPTAWSRDQRVELLLAAGRRDEAVAVLEEMASDGPSGRADGLLRELARERVAPPLEFPRRWALEARWEALRAAGADLRPDALHALIGEAARSDTTVAQTAGGQAALWTALDRWLLALAPPALAAVRQHQEEAGRRPTAALEDTGRRAWGGTSEAQAAQAAFALWRAYPWASGTQEAMMAFAERALRRGHAGLAFRCFSDVRAHAEALPLRTRAQAGEALAQRQEADRAAARPELRLADLQERGIVAPPVAPWAVETAGPSRRTPQAAALEAQPRLVVRGDMLLAGGPKGLVAYGRDTSAPLWWRTPAGPPSAAGRERPAHDALVVPGPFEPATDERSVFTRWGLDASGQFMTGVAALDLATGEVLWRTEGAPWSDGLVPVTDPALADGRLYVLAVRGAGAPVVPVWLVCLDARDGALLWQRFLTSCPLGLPRAPGAPDLAAEQVDLARYGNAPLVHLGAVYCLTNLGFVARCDARDGMLEWVRTYPRARLGRNLPGVLRRRGGLAWAGGAVVFAPRDCSGLFALDSATGRRLWEAPFAPSGELLGASGAAVVARDGGWLTGLAVASGEVLWERHFPEGIEGSPKLFGADVVLRSANRLWRVAAETGQTLERAEWPCAEPVRDFAVRGRQLLALTDRLTPPPPGSSRAAPRKLDLPLERAWSLLRPAAAVWRAPGEAGLGDRACILSRGVLECLALSAAPTILWRRRVDDGVRDVAWVTLPAPPGTTPTKAMLLFYPRSVMALDALSGECRWTAETDFDIRERLVCGGFLLVARPKQGREAAMLRLDSGQIAWQRSFNDLFGRPSFATDAVAWDGQWLHLLTSRFTGRREGPSDLLLRVADGWVADVKPFPPDGGPWPVVLACGDGRAYLVGQDKCLSEVLLAEGSARRMPVNLGSLDPRRIQRFEVGRSWVHLYWDRSYDAEPHKHWLVSRGEAGGVVRRKVWGELAGDTLFEIPDAGVVDAVRLPDGQTVTYRLPKLAEGTAGEIVGYHAAADRVFVLSPAPRSPRGAATRVDAFDRATGAHRATQLLPGVEGKAAQAAWGQGALLICDADAVHCFTARAGPEPEPAPVRVAYRLPPGALAGRASLPPDARDLVALTDPHDRRGSMHVAHDERFLYIVARYRDAQAAPWSGPPEASSGDWIELALRTNQGVYRWSIGLDAAGRTRLLGLGDAPTPAGTRALVAHEPATGHYSCELLLPWKGVFRPAEDWRQIALQATAWDDRPASGGPAVAFAWGAGDASGDANPARVYLDAYTTEQGEAVSAIVAELPDLPMARDLFRKHAATRAASSADLAERYWAFIRQHPESDAAEALLLELLRRDLTPRAALFDRAARLGVPAAVRERLAWQADACLSQWVHIGGGRNLRSALLEFNSGLGMDPWGHRAYWGKPIANWIVPPCEMGSLDSIPENAWHELRVPLLGVDLHDKPICGINFCQQGPPRIVWDRTAIVAGGRETMLMDDEAPRGLARGDWEWVAEPRRSGARAHSQPPPANHYEVKSHAILEFDEPVVSHLSPPLDRPTLSQWVWVDPQDPPAAVALGLHDGRGWAFRGVWGRPALRGRAMGPLPPPGQWHELRLPLAWTQLLTRPIAGVAFMTVGGRAVWDRTAIVAKGRETVVIEDELAAGRREQSRRGWQCWVEGHQEGTAPAAGRVGLGMRCDGRSGCVVVPHAPELDPPEFTVEAWVCLDTFAPGADTKQWVVNKNGHAWLDGYYGLVIYRDKVVADLNIGGEKENRFEAWSEEGALKLRQWHHLAMTYDGARLRLYRDAQPVAQAEVNKPRQPGRGALYLGRWANGPHYFAGTMDEVRVFSRALSEEEIRARFREPGTLAPQLAAAVGGYWGFDGEAAPEDAATQWQWVSAPVKSGRLAHTTAPFAVQSQGAVGKPMPAGHEAHLAGQPIVAHLPFDREAAVKTLVARLPALGPGDEGWRLFRDLLELEQANPRRCVERILWCLQTFPAHPRTIDLLGGLLEACTEAGEPDPPARVLELTQGFDLPVATLYQFHRVHVRTPREFVRNWQILGPFRGEGEEWGLDVPLPPEVDGVRLDRAYTGLAGELHWRRVAAEGSYVNLKALLGPAEHAVAYATAWAYSDRERTAVVAVGSDDRCKLWVNGRLALTGRNATYALPGEFIAPVALARGWNELLVKVTQGVGEWGFYFELLDERARGAPAGGRVAAEQPKAP